MGRLRAPPAPIVFDVFPPPNPCGRNTPPPAPQGRVSVDWTAPGTEGGNTATAAEPAPRKTGLGRLFEKERSEEEKVIIEVE